MNIHEFFQAAVDALQKYILIHYDRETWIEKWVGYSDVGKLFKTCGGELSNHYFYWSWAEAAYHKMAQQYTLYRCKKCNAVTDEHETHSWCAGNTVALTEEEACNYFWTNSYKIHEDILTEALGTEGWKAFCEGTHKFTDSIRNEILDCLTAIARDEGAMKLVALTWALNIHHRHSRITMDYGTIDGPLLHAVQQFGLQDMFGEEEINKFLAGEYPEIKIDREKLNSLCVEE